MTYLLDTQILIWAATRPLALPYEAGRIVRDQKNSLFFSAASIWEVAIKAAKGYPDFVVDAAKLHSSLLALGWSEIQVSSEHAIIAGALPPIHKDPFDRILIAQAVHESYTLLTVDRIIAIYSGPILRV